MKQCSPFPIIKNCYNCEKKFNLLNEKIYCNMCGKLFCINCLSNYINDFKIIKVCNKCIIKYNEKNMNEDKNINYYEKIINEKNNLINELSKKIIKKNMIDKSTQTI